MMGNSSHAHDLTCAVHRFLRLVDETDRIIRCGLLPLPFYGGQKLLERVNDRNAPSFAVLGAGIRIALNDQFSALEVAMLPFNMFGLAGSQSGICEELDKVGAMAGESSVSVSDFGDPVVEEFL